MRNLKLGLFTMIAATLVAGIGITTALEIQVWPQDYYWTLTLNRINIMKNNSITWIVLDGSGYSIKIWQGSNTDTWSIRVHQICDRSWNNCKLISDISTGTIQRYTWKNIVSNTSWGTTNYISPYATSTVYINHIESWSVTSYFQIKWNASTNVSANNGIITISSNHYEWTNIVGSSSTSNTDSSTLVNNPYLNHIENGQVKSYTQIAWGGNTTVSAQNGVITISSASGGSSLREPQGTSTIRPISNNAVNIKSGVAFSMASTTSEQQIYWLTVWWPISIWEAWKSNYIFMYAKWNTWDTDDRHYEIMWSNELAIWTINWGFIYFNKQDILNWNNQKYSIWINKTSPNATLDIKWSLRIGSECAVACWTNTRWTIVYRGGHFYWCNENGWAMLDWTWYNIWNTLPNAANIECSHSNYVITAQMEPTIPSS